MTANNNNIKMLEKILFDKYYCTNGSFESNVDFNIWADSARLILLNKLNIKTSINEIIEYMLKCQNSDGSWGIISHANSDPSYKNTLIAYHAIKNFISEKQKDKIDSFLKNYNGNRWIDPYTQMLISDNKEKIYYPPVILSKLPKWIGQMFAYLHMIIPCLFKWSIFLYPSAWSRHAFPQLTAIGYLLSNPNKKEKINQLITKIISMQLKNGSWFDTILPTIGAIYALVLYGMNKQSIIIQDGLNFLEQRTRPDFGLNRFNLSVWNTSLSLISLMHNKQQELGKYQNSIDFLLRTQDVEGGWAFSEYNIGCCDNDDTALAIIALSYAKSVGYTINGIIIQRGINYLLKHQNRDGGWGGFDHNQSTKKAGYLPPWHIEYGHELKDPSTADVTGHVLLALSLNKQYCKCTVFDKAVKFLKKDQTQNGYWYGRWGLCYTYGTSRAIIGLTAVDCNDECVQRGVNWLLSFQNEDGGWGENYLSYFEPNPLCGNSTLEQTSWVLYSLMKSSRKLIPAVQNGINYIFKELKRCQYRDLDKTFSASAIEPAIYEIYNVIFPLLCINEYNNLNQ
jgi:squalene cyclase